MLSSLLKPALMWCLCEVLAGQSQSCNAVSSGQSKKVVTFPEQQCRAISLLSCKKSNHDLALGDQVRCTASLVEDASQKACLMCIVRYLSMQR